MKKLLLAILLIPSISYADTVTSGSVGLLIPSTGVIDTSRRWDDKIYENFRIIASSLNTTISGLAVIATDTTTLQGILNTLSVDTTTLANRTPVINVYDSGTNEGPSITTLNFNSDLNVTVSGSTATINSAASGGGDGTAVSTVTFTFYGGGVFLSTANPIGTATHCVSKDTWTVLGLSAFTNKASSVGATSFTVWTSTSENYGVRWSSITSATVDLNQRFSNYISSKFPVYDREWIGVGIGTVATSGLQAEDWGVNLYLWRNTDSQEY